MFLQFLTHVCARWKAKRQDCCCVMCESECIREEAKHKSKHTNFKESVGCVTCNNSIISSLSHTVFHSCVLKLNHDQLCCYLCCCCLILSCAFFDCYMGGPINHFKGRHCEAIKRLTSNTKDVFLSLFF